MRLGFLALCLWLLLASVPAFAGQPASCAQTPPAGDRANAVVSGNFTATGVSGCFAVWGNFNIFIYGSGGPNGDWVGSVQLERSTNGGTTWVVAGIGGTGQQAIYDTSNTDVSVLAFEPEAGVIYRLDCTAYTSGTINYRMSTTGGASGLWVPNR
jgi:hypothetical protein